MTHRRAYRTKHMRNRYLRLYGWIFSYCAVACQHTRHQQAVVATKYLKRTGEEMFLDNGIRVIVKENHAAPVVAIQIWVRVGSADEGAKDAGIAHFIEHLLFKGRTDRGFVDVAKEIEDTGGDINAWTSVDHTVYHVVLPSRFAERGIAALAQTVGRLTFTPKDFEIERNVILEELREDEDIPARIVARDLFQSAYKKHPYGRPIMGTARSLQTMTSTQVHNFYRKHYTPQNMSIVVVGDVDPKQAFKHLTAAFPKQRSRPAVTAAHKRPEEPRQKSPRIDINVHAAEECHIAIAFHMPNITHPDTPVLDVAAALLGQGESALLTRRVRDRLSLVSDISAYAFSPIDPGLFVISATANKDRCGAAYGAILDEVSSLRAQLVDEKALERAKTLILGDATFQHETMQGQARSLAFFSSVSSSEFEAEYHRRVAMVDAENLRKIVRAHLVPANMTVVVLTPDKHHAKELRAEVTKHTGHFSREKRPVVLARTQAADGPKRVRLSNGVQIIVQRIDSVPIVAMRAAWLGGLRYETSENNGINALIAALLTRGTTNRSSEQINGAIERMAGTISGFSGANSLGLRMEILSHHWPIALEILADCMINSTFPANEFSRLRRAQLDELFAQNEEPAERVINLFNRTVFKKHPYRFDTLGTPESLGRLKRRAVIDYFDREFGHGNLALAVVGDIDPDQVIARAKSLFSPLTRLHQTTRAISPEPPITAPRLAEETTSLNQVHAVIGFSGTHLASKDRFALEIISALLSSQGGRLFRSLREKHGLVYHVSAFSQEGLDPGSFGIYFATSPKNLAKAVELIQTELSNLRNRMVSKSELRRIQRHLIGMHDVSLQKRSALAALLTFNAIYRLPLSQHRNYDRHILAVTPEKVRKAAQKYLAQSREVFVVLRPEDGTEAALKRFGTDQRAGVVESKSSPSSKD